VGSRGTVPDVGVNVGFKSIQMIEMDSNEIQTVLNKFKFIQTLIDSKRTFLS
jgi:hypothetical protein